ncbi:Sodium-dependent multivitamin transporter [Lamellibrachia satsuma]|nr:Sodium-dependent multivitamin transporter [Lamellibrachia satsuma]
MDSLHWVDYALFAAFLAISLGVGLYHAVTGERQRTTQEFIMANRQLKVIPTVISTLASNFSAIAVLGMTAEMYMFGSQMWLWAVISVSVALLFAERLAVPWFYPLKLTSVFEYFELRFKSKTLRMFASSFGIIQGRNNVLLQVLYMGITMYAPSAALDVVTGLPLTVTVPTMAAACVAYTALGGIRAVVWTDVFQFTIMVGGLMLVAAKASMVVGGTSKVFDIANSEGRIFWTKWDIDPRVRHTVWGLLFGGTLHWFAIYGTYQFSVQRYCATATMNQARMVLLLVIPTLAVTYSMFCLTGVIIVAYYIQTGCDPIASHQISTGNMLLPDFLNKEFTEGTGFRGVFLAMWRPQVRAYCEKLRSSSMSSALSGTSANIWEDILKSRLPNIDEERATWLNRLIVVVLGCLSTAFAFIVDQFPGSIVQVSTQILGAVGAPLLGLFLLGGLFRKAVAKGAIVGGVLGFALILYIGLGSLTVRGCHPTLPAISVADCDPPVNSSTTQSHVILSGISHVFALSYVWYTPLGAGTTIITGLISSYIVCYFYPSEEIDVPDKYFIHFNKLFSFNFAEKDIDTTKELSQPKGDNENDDSLANSMSKKCSETMSSQHMWETEATSSLLRDTSC